MEEYVPVLSIQIREECLKFSVVELSCPNYVHSLHNDAHHITKVDCLDTEGFLEVCRNLVSTIDAVPLRSRVIAGAHPL